MEKHSIKLKEKRVIVYFVFENEIISIYQKQRLIGHFKIDPVQLDDAKKYCLDKLNERDDVLAFIYIFSAGNIETELNVLKPKFAFHSDYSK